MPVPRPEPVRELEMSGGSFGGDVVRGLLGVSTNRVNQLKQLASGKIIQLSPKEQAVLRRNGDAKVVKIVLKRTPIPKSWTRMANVLTLGKFGRRMDQLRQEAIGDPFSDERFDDLFHLFMEVSLSNGKRVTLEKNARISLSVNLPQRPNTQEHNVSPVPRGLTLDRMLEATNTFMGDKKFYSYSAKNNNCQDFLLAVCLANHIGGGDEYSFIKQNVRKLFKTLPSLRKLSNTYSNLAARADVLVQGGGGDMKGYGARRSLLREFNKRLDTVKRVMGHGKTTNNIELEKAMRKLGLSPAKVGTKCEPKDAKYTIANESCKPPGTHWVAYYNGERYDPLGKDRSGTAEQNKVETNCGQRCIAYLLMCKAHKGYVNL
jgi:hypothetical protein